MLRKISYAAILLILLLVGCSPSTLTKKKCPDADISWVDVLKLNDIKYEAENVYITEQTPFEKGAKIGEVTFQLATSACLDHELQNGDAAYLPVGTAIYTIEGYKDSFRVFAGDRVFQAIENPNAKTFADLLDITGKVEKISLRSSYDESHLKDFTDEQMKLFIKDYLSLQYNEEHKMAERGPENTFLRIHLQDGSSFQINYWLDSGFITPSGIATDQMKEIITEVVP